LTRWISQAILKQVIKFRCPACRQKIKADGELAGKSGRCPHCEERLSIPTETDLEFRLLDDSRLKDMERMLQEAKERIQFLEQLNQKAESERTRIEEILKRNLVPQFAGFLEDKMMKKLREDHHQLSATNQVAHTKVDDLEARLTAAQEKMLQKLRAYEKRISELEAELQRTRAHTIPASTIGVVGRPSL
jgi:DNA repair exonuclease SbcCD ATPase subunit